MRQGGGWNDDERTLCEGNKCDKNIAKRRNVRQCTSSTIPPVQYTIQYKEIDDKCMLFCCAMVCIGIIIECKKKEEAKDNM